ncbi:MAG: hypothetical protein HY563_07210 [Ignavibacteriales bacterium]|nr:hypothetical protein [Ignavibacteriales bacterium]
MGLLFLNEYDPFDTTHKIASALNVFSVWQAVVIGIGISTISEKPTRTGISIAVILWAIWVAIGIPLGLIR